MNTFVICNYKLSIYSLIRSKLSMMTSEVVGGWAKLYIYIP